MLLVGLFLGFAVTQGITSPSVPSGDVALVEDGPEGANTVSERELKRAVLQRASQEGLKEPLKPGDEKFDEFQEAAMAELLEGIWIQGQAEELGIEPTQKQIDTELEQIKQQNFKGEAEFQEFVKNAGFTKEDILYRVKLQLLTTQIQEQITGQAPPATPAEIETYYETELESQFTEPETREARIVVNKDKAKIEDAKAQLEADNSPASWKKVAAEVSEDPNTKSKGGLQAGLNEELLQGQPELSAALFESDAGVIVGPTAVEGKFFLTEVVKLNPAKTQDLKEVQAQIQSQLDQQAQQTALADFAADFNSTWASRTFCAEGFAIVPNCSNYAGSGHPATAPPSCYEADPKNGLPDACPAPVQQSTPAFPGSVTELNEDGDRLPQRPRPEGLQEAEPELGLPGGGALPPPIAE
ncbi:MAG TPA: peptidyl-prolyl cis-trans isomerase [Solirubrobacterales bacterium]|nr:peptidyl-prolyl cis-trans isomerase [Solirubrobacterales bacterium]